MEMQVANIYTIYRIKPVPKGDKSVTLVTGT